MPRVTPINGELLRLDRESRGFSRIALLARIESQRGPSLGYSTLCRAEAGRASALSLKWFAQALGYPPERYRTDNSSTSAGRAAEEYEVVDSGPAGWVPKFDLSGTWRVYYLEDDVDSGPYLCVERLTVSQRDVQISGTYLPVSTDHPLGYVGTSAFRMIGLTTENIALGRYFRENVTDAQGAGVFQLVVGRGGAWAEGGCTFFADDAQIMVSLNIWIKEDSPEFPNMERQAKARFEKYQLLWKLPAGPHTLS